jgi:RHS repeat-associated protein
MHFTGKERDPESGLDNFGARYFGSIMGRFMSPDWSARPSTVPYSNLADPQSLNLYSYVRNNPTSLYDPTGHCWSWATFFCNVGQRVDNLFHGEGFHTDQGVEDIAHRNNASRRQQEVNGSAAGRLGTRLGRFERQTYDFLNKGCERGQCMVNLSGLFNPFPGRPPGRTLFRAVDNAEFENIQKTGKFGPSPGGAEHKYFYPTAEQATNMGDRMYGEGNYGIVGGTFPESAVEGPTNVATEGEVFVVPVGNLGLAEPVVQTPLDIPEVPE